MASYLYFKSIKIPIMMKVINNIKDRMLFVVVWMGIALISTGIAFIFIIGFKEVLGI